MLRHLKRAMKVLALVIFTFCGCSKAQPPLALAQQIANADRVVLTNSPSSSTVFSGVEAQKLVQAISRSEKIKMSADQPTSCPSGFYIQIYRGTNLLAQVEGHDDHFHTSGGFYHDLTGTLQTAWNGVSK